ncbi:hypothetical protein [uncultured Caulobacter sp.]|uniref:hypothetical protein n=1 Tax=uncultured Caulobacter sp. TaxID=158749 RepID=UPI0026087A64|nr:hypothetical protein [uncultured Caulobacter sp.]
MTTVTLYQPVGLEELQDIRAADWKAFPPHDIDQPIFRPVTDEAFAAQLARDWNAAHTTYRRGYIVRFEVAKAFLDQYEQRVSGTPGHEEYWIPPEDLPLLNAALQGQIAVAGTFADREAEYRKINETHA